jgi:hypothetical protein
MHASDALLRLDCSRFLWNADMLGYKHFLYHGIYFIIKYFYLECLFILTYYVLCMLPTKLMHNSDQLDY